MLLKVKDIETLKPILIGVNNIISVERKKESNHTRIRCTAAMVDTHYVIETVEEILEQYKNNRL